MSKLAKKQILDTRDVAEALGGDEAGWSVQRTRRWLLRTGAGIRRGGRVITTRNRLREHFPEVFEAVIQEGVGW